MRQVKLPKFLLRYFWESNAEELKSPDNDHYIIERLLDRGDEKAAKWLLKSYKDEDIKNIIISARGLSKSSRSKWLTYFKLDHLKPKLLAQRESVIWPY